MVQHQLAARGIDDPRVLAAMGAVPRDRFVPVESRHLAYADHPLPIGDGQTISQPYIVALTAQAMRVREADRVLDVGTGSGYAAAVLARLAAEVWSIERITALADRARRVLAELGVERVHVVVGDGTAGHLPAAPYDAIGVAAAAAEIPGALVDQLADGGRLVLPVGRDGHEQQLVRVVRDGARTTEEHLCPVRFVPLIPGAVAPDR